MQAGIDGRRRRGFGGGQGRAGAEEHADETQEVTEQFADASKAVPKVPEEVEVGIHAALIAEMTLDRNVP